MAGKKHSSLDRVLGRLDTLDSVNLTNLVQRLARERALFEEIFNTLQEGILVVRDDGAIEYANASAHRLIGLGSDDLAGQTHPPHCFEVLIADDGSTDGTPQLVRDYAARAPFRLRLLTLPADAARAPKKVGITRAIALATGELIATTDGDCRVGPQWLALLAGCYRRTGAALLSGGVTFTGERNLFEKMQTVEFASLVGSGACALGWHFPTMCNGANLAYAKTAFLAVDGFAGVMHLASGDDELLMHKIARRYPRRTYFLKNPASVVRTAAQPTARAFFNQRKRWASKWDAYQDRRVSLLAVGVFAANATLLGAGVGAAAGAYPFSAFLVQALVKCLAEWWPLRQFLLYLQPRPLANRRTALIPLVQLGYPFYVTLFGLAAQRKGYAWKGRRTQ